MKVDSRVTLSCVYPTAIAIVMDALYSKIKQRKQPRSGGRKSRHNKLNQYSWKQCGSVYCNLVSADVVANVPVLLCSLLSVLPQYSGCPAP